MKYPTSSTCMLMIANKETVDEACSNRKLLSNIRKRQATFFGHCMRRKGMEHLVTTGKAYERRSRGRQRAKILNRLSMATEKMTN